MLSTKDGPSSPNLAPLALKGGITLDELPGLGISEEMRTALEHAPSGGCVCWGIPFDIDRVVALTDETVSIEVEPVKAGWLVFRHTSDLRALEWNQHGFVSPMRGQGQLGEHAADYVVIYEDGTEERLPIRRRHQIGAFQGQWARTALRGRLIANLGPSGPDTSKLPSSGGEARRPSMRQIAANG